MKKFILIFWITFLFLVFSCASTDTAGNDQLTNEDEERGIASEELAAENEELKNENETLKNENEELRLENTGLAAGNDDLTDENRSLKTENEELKNEIEELAGGIEERGIENDLLKIENEQLRYRIADMELGINGLIDEMVQLTDANERLINRVDELSAGNEQLRSRIDELVNANELLQNQNAQLSSRISQLENENSELRRSNDDLRSRLDELRTLFTEQLSSAVPAPAAAELVQITQALPENQSQVIPPPNNGTAPEPAEEPAAPVRTAPLGEITAEPVQEPFRPYYAPAPAVRLESPAQMGMIPQDSEIFFSRIVHATAGQLLEIPFRGSGWVYMGEIASKRGIVYNSRRADTDGQTFIFSLDESGTYILKFNRQDFIRDFILNDHIQVIVGEAQTASAGWFNPSLDRSRVVAQPRWPSALEEAQIISGRTPSEPVITGAAPAAQEQSSAPSASVTPSSSAASSTPSTAAQITSSTPSASTQGTQTAASGAQGTSATSQSAQGVTSQSAQGTSASSQSAQGTSAVFSADPLPGSTPVYDPQSAGSLPVQTQPENLQQGAPQTDVLQTAAESIAPNELIQRVREALDRGNISSAISLLDQYLAYYPGGSDEALWLLGQAYEANSANRNILLSLGYYRRLVNEYPQSGRFEDARRRIAYLERFYINIR